MYRNASHPVRKCGKCKLNLKTSCGVFDNPHDLWHGRKMCPGYMNEGLYQLYLSNQQRAISQAVSKQSVLVRRAVTRLRQTETHHDGRHKAVFTRAAG
jgi:hypothetical protein